MIFTTHTKKEIFDWVLSIFVALLLAFLIRQFLFQPSQIKMSSMYPTLKENEVILVNKLDYKLHQPKRGDIIVFRLPDVKESYVKRIIGLPGEQIEIHDGAVYIDQKRIEEEYLSVDTRGYVSPVQLSENEFFVMGDNRGNSMDSRSFGPIQYSTIIGKAEFVYWPLKECKSLALASTSQF